MRSTDTDPAVERAQLAVLARLPAWRKVELIGGMNVLLTNLALSGQRPSPDRRDDDPGRRLDERRLGPRMARQLAAARASRGIVTVEDQYMTADPASTILAVIAALDRLAIPYYIGGSIAGGIHGTYRATADVDIIAEMRDDHADALAGALGERFYADAAMMRDAIAHCASFNVLDLQTGFKVDIFIPHGRAFDRSQFERRILTPLVASGDAAGYVASAEGTVLAKLEWYRLGGEVSERQWSDVIGILKVRAQDIDIAYLRRWAPQLGVDDLLRRALRDAGIEPRSP